VIGECFARASIDPDWFFLIDEKNNNAHGKAIMKTIATFLAVLALVSYPYLNVAQAEGANTYIGIGAGSADTSLDCTSCDVDLDFLVLQLGVWTTDNTSIEIRMGKGSGDDSIGPLDIELESFGGLYGTYHWNLGNHASVYGIAGWSTASLKVSSGNDSLQDDEDGLSYGAGMKFSILSVEYIRYLDTSDVEADAVSVGLHYTFE
jgi:opacity protein-like surface antigen